MKRQLIVTAGGFFDLGLVAVPIGLIPTTTVDEDNRRKWSAGRSSQINLQFRVAALAVGDVLFDRGFSPSGGGSKKAGGEKGENCSIPGSRHGKGSEQFVGTKEELRAVSILSRPTRAR